MADTVTSTRIDLARQYLAFQQKRKLDQLLAMMADDIALTLPMVGPISGKSAVEQQLRSRPMGGGKSESQLNDGYSKLMAIRRKQFNEYVHRLDVVGLSDRRERRPERIRPFIDPPRN